MGARPTTSSERPSLESITQHAESLKALAEELVRAVRQLPRVEPDGTSECSFAEELYAKKEELEQQLRTRYGVLHSDLQFVESEIQRCKNNLVVVRARHDQLNGDRAREQFSQAEVELSDYYERCVQTRDRVQEAIQFVQGILDAAASKKYPGHHGTGLNRETRAPTQGSSDAPALDGELEGLFELDRGRRSAGEGSGSSATRRETGSWGEP